MSETIWRRFTKKTMPPMKENVLLWRGLTDSDGGFPLIGKLYADPATGELYIVYKVNPAGRDGVICPEEFRSMLWAEIEVPERARRKREKELEQIRRNMSRRRLALLEED